VEGPDWHGLACGRVWLIAPLFRLFAALLERPQLAWADLERLDRGPICGPVRLFAHRRIPSIKLGAEVVEHQASDRVGRCAAAIPGKGGVLREPMQRLAERGPPRSPNVERPLDHGRRPRRRLRTPRESAFRDHASRCEGGHAQRLPFPTPPAEPLVIEPGIDVHDKHVAHFVGQNGTVENPRHEREEARIVIRGWNPVRSSQGATRVTVRRFAFAMMKDEGGRMSQTDGIWAWQPDRGYRRRPSRGPARTQPNQ